MEAYRKNFRGSAIARIVGQTTKAYSNEFDPTVRMWVGEFYNIYESG